MTHSGAAACLALALASTACGGGRRDIEIDPNRELVGGRWNAILSTPKQLAGAVQLKGNGWMGPEDENTSKTRAHVAIANAVPGGEHPWHVHLGQCGNDRGIFGPPNAYQPLEVGKDGRAESEAELPVAFPVAGQYFINVHASRNNMGTIIGCGNLAPPSR
ncbi:MAG TPA: hypothetical protein VH764_06715 [Gemmatimonadales bacterium]